MAKLVDALCSGRSVRKDVLVRILGTYRLAPEREPIFFANVLNKMFSTANADVFIFP